MTRRSFFALLSAPLLAGLAACKSPFSARFHGVDDAWKPPEDTFTTETIDELVKAVEESEQNWQVPDDFWERWLLNQLPGGPR